MDGVWWYGWLDGWMDGLAGDLDKEVVIEI